MKHFFPCLALLVLLCTSCANDLPEMASKEPTDPQKTNLDYALACAEELINQIDPQTRGVSRKANVQFVCNESTRAAEQDTILYLVNYDDNMGFALLDAEGKNGGVYAISPKGHLEFGDSVGNPVLSQFFDNVKRAASTPLIPDSDNIIVVGWAKTQYRAVAQAAPILCDRYSNWTCENISGAGSDGAIANVSTAAVAMAKILAFYTHPSTIGGTSINWNYISGKSYKPTEVHKLLCALNSSSFLKDRYPAGSEDADRRILPSLVRNALTTLGLTDPYLDFSNNTAALGDPDNLYELKRVLGYPRVTHYPYIGPVIAYSNPSIPNDDTNSSFDTYQYIQYWIVDGFMDVNRFALSSSGQVIQALWPNDQTLLHCVWGLNDYLNGYYALSYGYGDLSNKAGFLENGEFEYETQYEQYHFLEIGILGGYDLNPETQP